MLLSASVISMATLAGKNCSSCGRLTNQYVDFACPRCSETIIVRCDDCRKNYTRYRCSKCHFEGP